MDAWYARHLICPRHALPLAIEGSVMTCDRGHAFPVVDGVPVLLLDDAPQTIGIAQASIAAARRAAAGDMSEAPFYVSTLGITEEERRGVLELAAQRPAVDPVASYLVGATNGIMYKDLIGRLQEYPIPTLRLVPEPGARLLDVGCSWGRWSIAAARAGFEVVSLDPSLGAVLAARRIARSLGLTLRGVVADARHLPFADGSFDRVFSYSVLQHFSPEDARAAIAEMGRVLRSDGLALVQMANRFGIRCLYHQARRGFRTPVGFDVRYWWPEDLTSTFSELVGPAALSVDGFFGLGMQASDAKLMGRARRALLFGSELLRAVSTRAPQLCRVADSVYVEARRRAR